MTKKEKVQIDNLRFRLNTILECTEANSALCVDADGAYTHNAMVVRNHIMSLISEIERSIKDRVLIIKPYAS